MEKDLNLCRICLNNDGVIPLFSYKDGQSVVATISSLFNIHLNYNENLPSTVCIECMENLKISTATKECIINSDIQLNTCLIMNTRNSELKIKDHKFITDDVTEISKLHCSDLKTDSSNDLSDCTVMSAAYACEKCEFKTNFYKRLIHHLKTHSDDKLYECERCGSEFKRNTAYIEHVQRRQDPLVCCAIDSKSKPDTNSNSPPPQTLNGKKRKRNYDSWQRVASKREKNCGNEYKNAAGRIIPSKSMKSGCSLKCRLKCQERVSHDIRMNIFNYYYKLGNKEGQWEFIAQGVKVIDKKITKVSTGNSRRKSSRLYYLNYSINNKDESTRVCLQMFLDTLAISNQVVDTALTKFVGGGVDNRGKYARPVNEVKEVAKKHVMDHISTFLTKEETPSTNISITKMYRLYVKWIEDKQIQEHIVTERQYRYIYNLDFNVRFSKSKKEEHNDCLSDGNIDL